MKIFYSTIIWNQSHFFSEQSLLLAFHLNCTALYQTFRCAELCAYYVEHIFGAKIASHNVMQVVAAGVGLKYPTTFYEGDACRILVKMKIQHRHKKLKMKRKLIIVSYGRTSQFLLFFLTKI